MSSPLGGKSEEIARESYRLNVERLKIAMHIQADYGKWLIATLSLVHTAALYALATSLKTAPRSAAMIFLAGLGFTLLSGLFSWTNFSLYLGEMERMSDPHMIYYRERWPKLSPRMNFWIGASLYGAITLGVLSALCVVGGAMIVFVSRG